MTKADTSDKGSQIPVFISQHRTSAKVNSEARIPVRKTLRRNNVVLQAMELPVVMNLNPRSIYNKTDDFKLLLEQYQGDVICISESWEPDSFSLEQLLQLDGFRIISRGNLKVESQL